ncbi:ser/thr protein kinase-like protein [Yokapox virus]|uniref:Ser/thr protein kinase-like protein n=1 Tax=Yokapox virus TaxID=1076255 RepID=G3EI56_9POXV|nr:ser/thr protein kinase-like protein [Yokapox virus]AEN03753.1 ser/thr protein kinase-like protein [Yokapox virus]
MELRNRYIYDNNNNKWVIGDILHSGNSILYKVKKKYSYVYSYVMKIDNKTYKPLLNEINICLLLSLTNKEYIKKWIKTQKFKYLAVPIVKAVGVTDEYRFIITKYLGNVFKPKPIDIKSIYTTSIAIINALEYIHSHGLSHGNVEPNNILINNNIVTLIDYTKCKNIYIGRDFNKHIPYKEDNIPYGNIKYMCLDYHRGAAVSRRGDLEMLGYCIIEWFGGKLPWEKDNCIMNLELIKSYYLNNIDKLIEECFPNEFHLDILRYLEYVYELDYNQKPDYNKLRELFTTK